MLARRSLTALLLAGTLLLLGACGRDPAPVALSPAPAATPAAQASAAAPPAPTVAPAAPTAPPVAVPADLRAAIVAAVRALDERGPYRMQITSTLDANPAELIVVPPDRSRYTASSAGQVVEMISIGDTSYMRGPDGTWQTIPSSEGGLAADELLTAADAADIQSPEALGEQLIAGVRAVGYRFASAAEPGITSAIWVGPDGAPVLLTTESEGEVTTYTITYDPALTVEAPAP